MAYCLQQLLTESAVKTPQKEALRFRGEGLSYAQLDKRSNQLARALQDAGVKRGDRVGIYMKKSFPAVISLFGILKVGGVYVPMDQNAPSERLAYISRNCGIKVLLTASEKISSLLELDGDELPISTFILGEDAENIEVEATQRGRVVSWAEVSEQKTSPIESARTVDADLAYILYTSGSSGEPKGVMISHRSSLTFIKWCADTFGISPDDRVSSHAPLHFDLSILDIFVTIQAGGTVVLVPENLSVFPVKLVELLQEEKITVTYLVPSILSMMVNYGKLDEHDLSRLRLVLFAGEVFPIKYLSKLASVLPQVDLYNLYGPTETNACTYYKVQAKDLEAARPVPIGIACENTEVFAVDDEVELVTKPGVEGELWVRGATVAAGYWGDPEKTAQRFVANKFQDQFQEIAYRTGDIVMLEEDGVNWLFLGRRDHMIKSRGYRIELGEIEAALYALPEVKEAAAVAIPDELIGNRIKAALVLHEGSETSAQDLKAYCQQKLPKYMVPESFEFFDALPKTSTGKVNRPLLVEMNSG